MAKIIDFHVHVFPSKLETLLQKKNDNLVANSILQLKNAGKAWMKPYSLFFHQTQPIARHIPKPIRGVLDQVGSLAILPNLIFESSEYDLRIGLDRAEVDYAVTLSHPPHTTNEYLFEVVERNPKLIPAVNIPKDSSSPKKEFLKWIERGAKLLKIHAASDGDSPETARYIELLDTAADHGLPVIIHTGEIQNRLFYQDPKQGRAEIFESWFQRWSHTSFILAHMNFHEPAIALDLAQRNPNVYVDTSWQPTEAIAEACRRIGSDRVLYATDWPLVGHNFKLGINRVRAIIQTGLYTQEDVDRILGKNAQKILGIE